MLPKYRLIGFAFLICATIVSSQSMNKTIPLDKTLTDDNRELYGDFVYLNRSSTLRVNFTDIGSNLSFIIFQVHSHFYDIMLCRTECVQGKNVTGINLGLYSKKGLDTFYVVNSNENNDLRLFIAVHGYKDTDPIPGGCNMEFPVPISPFMTAQNNNKTYIIVKAPPPQSEDDPNCINVVGPYSVNPQIIFYMMYLPELNYEPEVYFDAIRKMSTRKSILEHGRRVAPGFNNFWTMRRMFSAYPGTGTVYVAVVYFNDQQYSIYTPTHSYACSPQLEYDCELLDDTLSNILSAALFFLGIFMCYFGHNFFKTHILFVGFLSGSVITYIVLSLMFTINGPALVFVSGLSGLCVGSLRVVTWWLYGIPAFVLVLSSADVGFLIASLFYYATPVQASFLEVDFNFWPVFILIMLLVTLCFLSISYIANLLCCAVIGAYTAIYPIDYYLGSNLKFILNNTIRRATVVDFNRALIMPPFQWRDWLLSCIWMLLTTTGFLYQYYSNRGRPPFPPPPRSVREIPADQQPIMAGPSGIRRNPNVRTDRTSYYNERTPLLA